MVILPAGFVATRYPGYFWFIPEQELYSLKGNGILTRLTKRKAYMDLPVRYTVSHEGKRHYYSLEYLTKLKYPDTVEQIPVEELQTAKKQMKRTMEAIRQSWLGMERD